MATEVYLVTTEKEKEMKAIVKTTYKDRRGSYSITEHDDGTATLRCRNSANNHLDVNKKYKSVKGAKIALGRHCGGMPQSFKDYLMIWDFSPLICCDGCSWWRECFEIGSSSPCKEYRKLVGFDDGID